jgi:hypothetical protein
MGTLDYGLRYVTDHEFGLYGYFNSDWAGNIPDQKSTLTYCFIPGFSMFSWNKMKKSCVAISTVEAEYVEACAVRYEAMWLQKLMTIGLNLTYR